MISMNTYNDDDIYTEGQNYVCGQADGTQFDDIIFVGRKSMNGKPVLVFKTLSGGRELKLNPSYLSFSLEKDLDISEETEKETE
tara:strand:- start:252 stop:503 length:252 start_codon:yes stop_codon:yes gene_type:complete